MAIKISDLSVGDWVQNNYGDYVKVAGIWQGYNLNYQVDLLRDGMIGTYLPCYIHPIPITAEILEKNGFEKMYRDDDNRYYLPSYIEVTLYEDGWWHTINANEHPIHALNGVHQLQHLLRLAGVEKEINL